MIVKAELIAAIPFEDAMVSFKEITFKEYGSDIDRMKAKMNEYKLKLAYFAEIEAEYTGPKPAMLDGKPDTWHEGEPESLDNDSVELSLALVWLDDTNEEPVPDAIGKDVLDPIPEEFAGILLRLGQHLVNGLRSEVKEALIERGRRGLTEGAAELVVNFSTKKDAKDQPFIQGNVDLNNDENAALDWLAEVPVNGLPN